MMPPDNLVAPPPPANKDENHHHGPGSSSSRKTASRPAEPQALKCPRCDSPNTKFCYYNNYSLTQPRHFCKTCRRYWTKGGALRNVPIGGGCRKNKKISKSACSRLSSADSKDSANTASYIDLAGFKFFNGLSPAMDFQLGGGGGFNNYPPGFHNNYNHQLLSSSFGDVSTPLASSSTTSCFGVDPSGNNSASLIGFNFPLSSNSCGVKQDDGNEGYKGEIHQDMGLASSIESLSSINQDLHWKLQQQRLAMLFGGGENDQQKETTQTPLITQKSQPILFQNLEISSKLPDDSRKDNINGNLETEWYFDNSNYAASAVNIPTSTPANSNSTGNGFQAWGNFNQYTPLP